MDVNLREVLGCAVSMQPQVVYIPLGMEHFASTRGSDFIGVEWHAMCAPTFKGVVCGCLIFLSSCTGKDKQGSSPSEEKLDKKERPLVRYPANLTYRGINSMSSTLFFSFQCLCALCWSDDCLCG